MNYHAARDLSEDDRLLSYGQPARELPENLVAEQQVLGAIMINNAVLDAIKVPLAPDHFYEPLHRKIYQGILDLKAEGKIIKPVTLGPYLPKGDKVGDMTVFEYVGLLAGEACSIVLAPQLAGDIYKAAAAREAIFSAQEMVSLSYDRWSDLSFMDQITALASKIQATVSELKERDHQSPGNSYLSVFESSAAQSGVIGVPVALPELAKVLNEPVFEAGNLYGLLSSSGEGKSSLTMQLIYHAVKEGHPVLFLSYDQSAAQCVRQMIAQVHGIDIRQQRDPSKLMKQTEQDTCVNFAMWLDKQPLDIIRCQREGVSQLVSYARRFISKRSNGKTPFIVIDHIGKVKARDPRLSPDRISGEVTVELKAFADETQSAVLILNQRNSEGTKRLNPRPISRDLYGGEGAKQDYDAVAYLYRPAKYKADMTAVATEKDWKNINGVFAEFGTEIDTVAEVGVIKARFADPSVREWLKFEARYTRYVSSRPAVAQERML